MRKDLQTTFDEKTWARPKGNAPRSGLGSNMKWTANLRAALPGIFRDYNVRTFVDAPCCDWFWMQHVDLTGIEYIGGDIAPSIVQDNAAFASDTVRFEVLDITSDALPACDMMMVRDCLFHLRYDLRWAFFKNFAQSDCKHLMLTMHHTPTNVEPRRNGGYKPFNPMAEPFNLPAPLQVICETADSIADNMINPSIETNHRSLGIWTHDQIVTAVANRTI